MSKTYIIGDIHGCYDELIALSNQIGITEDDLLISLGDIVDRGNKSVELYHYFKHRKNAIVLMGNHERKHLNGVLSYSQEIVKIQFDDEYDDFTSWVDTLPYYYETEDAIIIHAFFEHDVTLQDQKQEVLAGTSAGSRYLEKKYGTEKYWSDYYTGDKPIIYGHHVVGLEPKIYNNTYGIDTKACHGGRLTILELPGFKIHQIDVPIDYWTEQQSIWQIPVLNAKNWEAMKIDQIKKQLEKLSYKKEPEIKTFLKDIENWVHKLIHTRILLKEKLEQVTVALKEQYQDTFHKEVATLIYSAFIYKASTNNLHMADIEKLLDTPQKIINLAIELQLPEIPYRKAYE